MAPLKNVKRNLTRENIEQIRLLFGKKSIFPELMYFM